ncbi:hypothetical protein BD309DRAFT_124448 [Dichomitus squalens]|nr:hypothetical protein BD309DRAFT_124448 [Dichomitus squalens]
MVLVHTRLLCPPPLLVFSLARYPPAKIRMILSIPRRRHALPFVTEAKGSDLSGAFKDGEGHPCSATAHLRALPLLKHGLRGTGRSVLRRCTVWGSSTVQC